jgi:hypothetical protein
MDVSHDLIRQIATQLQSLPVDSARAAELAIEVTRLNGAILGASGRICFTDEPGAFRALLERRGK